LLSTGCERFWTLRTLCGLTAKGEPETRGLGTIIHTCLAYYYAARLPNPPKWFRDRTLAEALERDSKGRPALLRTAEEIFDAWRHRYAVDKWEPVCVEEEFEATIGEIDPSAPSAGANAAVVDREIVTCRTDLVIQSGGALWIVDHKSTGGEYGAERLPAWRDDGEWKLNWQILLNLAILRTPKNQARLGGMIRGFIVQRIKQRRPFDFDRNVVPVPLLAYQEVGRAARAYVSKELEIYAKAKRGERPIPNFGMCYGRYGKCDYFDLCAADSKESQTAIMNLLYATKE
jgi:hypothetical protein